ncbi:AbrB family transcriptional regulator [Macrococcus capreoli]|uniref:AbrB family transcriptional regulator n=2 Tax=Macrococcus capreoli TaxID=2982690 RepID=UPI0021D61226|nr:AbrB family transcriptional regulator [Macrococcus sp. TMW 2.2395]
MMPYLILFIVSFIFGWFFQSIGMILPWLFGPISAAIALKKYSRVQYYWPKGISDIGLYILGAQIGVSFTKEILGDIAHDFLSIVLLSVLIVVCAIVISLLFKKIVGCSTETALLSSIPGALNQMIVMAEENKNASLLIVTLTQTSRLLFVIMFVPFISRLSSHNIHPIELTQAKAIYDVLNIYQMMMLIVFIAVSIYCFKIIHLPVPDMLGPIFVIVIWNLSTGQNFTVPMPLINIAQILFGIRIGLQMYDLSSQINRKLFIGIFVQNFLLIMCAILMSIIVTVMTHHPFNDVFLSAAPGGMAQIVIVALETGANVAMISSYHIFRIFFILLAVTPLMSLYLKWRNQTL